MVRMRMMMMLLLLPLLLLPCATVGSASLQRHLLQSSSVAGIDVSSNNGAINWTAVASAGVRFAFVKSTEGLVYPSRTLFAQQYDGAYSVGIIRGAYHFGRPDVSTGGEQAAYFVSNGGRWSGDGMTLPGALDMEWCAKNDSCPADPTCYGLTTVEMGAWITDFVNTYYALTNVYPVIYTNNEWYKVCVGTTADFSSNCPLWLSGSSSSIPYNWPYYTFYQTGQPYGIDLDIFNGPFQQLQALATNG